MTEDFQNYIETTPIEKIIKHKLFYQLTNERELEQICPDSGYIIKRPGYWKITFQSNDMDVHGFYTFFGSKSPQNYFIVYKQRELSHEQV